jgi:hypothetical protein
MLIMFGCQLMSSKTFLLTNHLLNTTYLNCINYKKNAVKFVYQNNTTYLLNTIHNLFLA